MKKFFKSKKFVGALALIASAYFGLPPVFAPVITDAVCEQAECAE